MQYDYIVMFYFAGALIVSLLIISYIYRKTQQERVLRNNEHRQRMDNIQIEW